MDTTNVVYEGTNVVASTDLLMRKYNIDFAKDLIQDFLVGPKLYLQTIYMNAVRDMTNFIQFPLEWHVTNHLDKHVNNKLLQYKSTVDKEEQQALYRLTWTHSLDSEDLIVIVENRLDYVSFDENLQVFFTVEDDYNMVDFFLQMIDTRAFYVEL